MTRKIADDVGVDPGDGFELTRPITVVVGPGEPGCRVRFPIRPACGSREQRDFQIGCAIVKVILEDVVLGLFSRLALTRFGVFGGFDRRL